MNIIVCKDYAQMSEKAASLAADSIRENPGGLISFPGGDTPIGMVQRFVDMVNKGEADISRNSYVSLDEWVGLSQTDIGSCGLFNSVHLLKPLKKSFARVHLIDGASNEPEQECLKLNRFIDDYGPLSLSVVGLGMNGHLGFNEAGVDFQLQGHVISLDATTKMVMKKYFGDKFHPTQGITQGIAQIMSAGKVILIASGSHKADILYRTVCGEVTREVPSSVLKQHPNCSVVVDEEAAAKL